MATSSIGTTSFFGWAPINLRKQKLTTAVTSAWISMREKRKMHPKRETLNQSAELLLRDLEQKELTIKERNQIPLQEMATQEPSERIFNMAEVALGYTEAQVRVEALRCLQCKTKPCIKGCPVGIDIPAFI